MSTTSEDEENIVSGEEEEEDVEEEIEEEQDEESDGGNEIANGNLSQDQEKGDTNDDKPLTWKELVSVTCNLEGKKL